MPLWFRKENEELVNYLISQTRKLNIGVKLGAKFTPELIVQFKPDVIVVATGAIRHNPLIPGIERKNVINGDNLRQMLSGQLSENTAGKLTFWQKAISYSFVKLLQPLLNPLILRNFTKITGCLWGNESL